jgi:Ni/Co efflux regulator RcnB
MASLCWDSRRRHAIENKQHCDQPEDRIDDLNWEFHCREEEREQANMTGDGKWSEGSKVASVLQCEQAERDDHQQYGLLVDMPAE